MGKWKKGTTDEGRRMGRDERERGRGERERERDGRKTGQMKEKKREEEDPF